ncbi:MAG: hypothetical protein V4568_09720 [Pseudomonadota bacterium]
MAKRKLSKLQPRYSFILNPYSNERLSKCPKCHRPTHLRKFALLIDVEERGLIILGKTCRYCTPCELIITHQDELEGELWHNLHATGTEMESSKYMVLGTVDKTTWQSGLQGSGPKLDEVLKHTTDFKQVLDLKVKPGGWYPASQK